MRRNVIGTVLVTILILGALGAIGFGLYQFGYQQGLVETGGVVVNRIGSGLHHAWWVLANLISNAAAQMPDRGTLRVEAGQEGGSLVVAVSDTGPGIPEDRLERVFERFVMAGDSRGTRLGLSSPAT